MPGNGGAGEKSEKPTAKKRKDERKEGHLMQSKEMVTAFSLIAVYYSFTLLYPISSAAVGRMIKECINLVQTQIDLEISDITGLYLKALIVIAVSALPILLIAGIAGTIPTIAQTKMYMSMKSVKPKFSNMNPLNGLKKMFSLKGVIELLKAAIKVGIMIIIIYVTLKGRMNSLAGLMGMTISQAVYYTGEAIMSVVKNVAIAFAFVALFDYLYQRWEYEKDIRMTKQEIKEEYKQTEGDPVVKGKIRQIQRQRAMNRMMQNVPDADVIIRNPTHYAIALKYDSNKNQAPVVVAKGVDLVALKIVEIGKKHNVHITENKPLARALYDAVEIGWEIPKDFYQAVADVLAFVYSMKRKRIEDK